MLTLSSLPSTAECHPDTVDIDLGFKGVEKRYSVLDGERICV